MTQRLAVVVMLVLGAVAAGCSAAVPAQGRVTRLAVRVETEPTGALLVREAFDIEPDATGAVSFERRIAVDRADGIEIVSVEADGVRVAAGEAGLALPTLDQHEVLLRWTPTPGDRRVRTLALTLRAVAGVAVTEPRAHLTWPVLPSARGYAVERVDVELTLPPGTATYAGTGMIEPGWSVARTSSGITATRAPVPDGEAATLVATFDFDRSAVTDPVWERSRDRQRQFLPALVAGAVFFFIIGAGTLIILRAQYPTSKALARSGRPGPPEAERVAAARGLVVTGIVGAAVAAGSSVLAANLLASLGVWVQIIPASMLIVAAVFVVYGPRLRR